MRRHRSARRLLAWAAVPAVFALTVAPAAMAAPTASAAPAVNDRPATTYTQYDLVVDPTSRTSSTHRALQVFFQVSDDVDTPSSAMVSLTGNGAIESHLWQFPVSSGLTGSTTSVTLNSGSALGTYGSLKISTTVSGAGKNECLVGEVERSQPVSVKVTYSFNTHSTGSKAWGTVSGTQTLKGNIGSFTNTPCTPKVDDCTTGVSWGLFQLNDSGGGNIFIGNTGADGLGKVGDTDLGRVVELSSPAGASRTDVILAKEPLPKLTKHGSGATVSVTTSGSNITGSATLKSLKGSHTSTQACSPTKTQKDVDWVASFTNGSKALTAHEQIFGNITAKNITKTTELDGASIDDWSY